MNSQYHKLVIICTYIRIIYDELLRLELENKLKTKEYNYLISELSKLREFEKNVLNKIYLSDLNFNENISLLKQDESADSDNKYVMEIYDRIQNMLRIKAVKIIEKGEIDYSNIMNIISHKNIDNSEEEYFINKYIDNTINRSIESGFLYLLNKTTRNLNEVDMKKILVEEKYRLAYSTTILENELILSNYNKDTKRVFIYSNNIGIDTKYKINDMKVSIIRKRLSQLIDLLKESSKTDYDSNTYKLKLYIIELYIRSLGLIVDIKEYLIEYLNSDNLVANSVIDAIIKLSDEDKKAVTDVPPIYKFPNR